MTSQPDPYLDLIPPFLTDTPGTGGTIRVEPSDFFVEEIPAYRPSGAGQHVLFQIEKTGIPTMVAMDQIARALGLPSRSIGCAGLKDAHAVTRQYLSVEGASPDRVLALEFDNIRILAADWHRNRLKIGHLRGNCFAIRIRDVGAGAMETAVQVLTILSERGVPNGFGPQRFGSRSSSHMLGRALVMRDADAFFDAFLGQPRDTDSPQVQLARERAAAGDYQEAAKAWAGHSSPEWRALRDLSAGAPKQRILASLPRSLKRLWVAAYQSLLFNRILTARMPHLEHLEDGDLAIKHANGAFFLVEDANLEQPRADTQEISPSGPLFGYKSRLAEGEPGRDERQVLEQEHLGLESFRIKGLNADGARRPLRVPVSEPRVTEDASGLLVRFSLPSGAYATNVIREITKND